MIETSTLTQLTPFSFVSPAGPVRQSLSVTRIKSYTRKLAEIERFIEHYGKAPEHCQEPNVTIHRYWHS